MTSIISGILMGAFFVWVSRFLGDGDRPFTREELSDMHPAFYYADQFQNWLRTGIGAVLAAIVILLGIVGH